HAVLRGASVPAADRAAGVSVRDAGAGGGARPRDHPASAGPARDGAGPPDARRGAGAHRELAARDPCGPRLRGAAAGRSSVGGTPIHVAIAGRSAIVTPAAPVTLVTPVVHTGGPLTLAATLQGSAPATVWASDAVIVPIPR